MKKMARWLILTSLWLYTAMAQAGTVTYVYTDPQGTPLAEADASGNITARFDYAPYGIAVASVGPAPNGPGYTGHVNDPDTGLVYMRARYYDPTTGRFISPDPVRLGVGNLFNFSNYDYANNNPINQIDADGRYTCNATEHGDFCAKIDAYVDKLKESKDALKPGSSDYKVVNKVLVYIGAKGVGGPNYVPGSLPGFKVAETDQKGTTTVDMTKISGSPIEATKGASNLGHEAQHDLDTLKFGVADDEKSYRRTETNAYGTQGTILKGLGLYMTSNELHSDIEKSVQLDLGKDANKDQK